MSDLTLAQLNTGDQAVVTALQGGCAMQHRLRSVGMKEGKPLRVVTKHHFSGPVVVEIEERNITIGRGMAQRVAVERMP